MRARGGGDGGCRLLIQSDHSITGACFQKHRVAINSLTRHSKFINQTEERANWQTDNSKPAEPDRQAHRHASSGGLKSPACTGTKNQQPTYDGEDILMDTVDGTLLTSTYGSSLGFVRFVQEGCFRSFL